MEADGKKLNKESKNERKGLDIKAMIHVSCPFEVNFFIGCRLTSMNRN